MDRSRGGEHDGRDQDLEATEDALVDGGVAYRPGSARAALAHRSYRLVWIGSMASNIGSWMQNVALGAFAYELTHSAGYVALLSFAQLGPLLALSILGGVLADAVNRKVLLYVAQGEQLVMSIALAWVARGDNPSQSAIFLCVLAVGIGNALNGPVFSAVLPMLVGRRDLAGAVSLQSVQLNLSRVIGPAIGGLLLPALGAPWVFSINAATYLFAIAAIATVDIPRPYPPVGEQGLRRLLGGFVVARRDRVVRNCLLTMASMSFFSLPFVGLMPVIAAERLGIDVSSFQYGVLYAAFGLGAAAGAVSVGTVFVESGRPRLVRTSLLGFALLLGAFAAVRSIALAYPVAFLLGFCYFATVTALSTHLQESLEDTVRGRVMSLWIMAFGGTVPIGILAGGVVAARTSIETVLLIGAAYAAALAIATRLEPTPHLRSLTTG